MTSFNWDELIDSADDIKDEFALIEPGYYDLVVLDASAGLSGNGNQMIKVTYQFPEGGINSKRRLFTQHMVMPANAKSMGFFFRAMEVYGFDKTWVRENKPTLDELADGIIGKVVNVKVTIEDHFIDEKRDAGEQMNVCGSPRPAKGDISVFGNTTGETPIPSVAPTPKPTSVTPEIPSF